MHLSQIRIENFRNLKNVSIKVHPGLNALAGANNSGKTNLFKAIQLALGPHSSRSEPIWLDEDDLYTTAPEADGDSSELADEPKEEDGSNRIFVQLIFSQLNHDERSHFFEIIDFPAASSIQDAPARINCEAVWDDKKERFKTTRWGGSEVGDRTPIPQEILESLPLILLPALRNAEDALTPGNKSMLARVLEYLSKKVPGEHDQDIEKIFLEANNSLEKQDLISTLQSSLRKSTRSMAGTIYTNASVKASEPVFRRILKTLRVVLEDAPVDGIHRTGMGYNNLLFIGTLLSYLSDPVAPECPILLVEEPEAHLNPQMIVLLAEHLAGLNLPQILVSTHSPTFAAHVRPSQVLILLEENGEATCRSLNNLGMTDKEERQLQRMLDITRASLYFAKGIILVEGISEALLVPEIAQRLGIRLQDHHVSVIPICGVDFGTFSKLFSEAGLNIPVSIITDADPPIKTDKNIGWQADTPDVGEKADRVKTLETLFQGRNSVELAIADVTLEYDLAKAGKNNPTIMAKIWEDFFKGTPGTFKESLLEGKDHDEQVLVTWRGICRASSSGSKADFAHLLATWLAKGTSSDFHIPAYIERAIKHVVANSETKD